MPVRDIEVALLQVRTLTLGKKDFALLVFDLDGVLVSTTRCHESAYRALWRHIGITGPEYAAIAGRTTSDVIREVTGALDPSERQVDAWIRFKQSRARDLNLSMAKCFPDTMRTLRSLSDRGISLALGTSASTESMQLILDRFALRPYFSSIVNAKGDIRGKPHPDVYSKIGVDLRIPPDSTLIIEDSASGLQAAMAAHAYAISVRTGLSLSNDRFLGAFDDLGVLCVSRPKLS